MFCQIRPQNFTFTQLNWSHLNKLKENYRRAKLNTVNADIFAGLIFRVWQLKKHIRGLLNSRWADAHLSFLYCTINIIQWMIPIYKYLCDWAAQKQADLRQTWVYYPFASTHMVNTQLLRVQNVHTKYRKYFRGFLNSRLLKKREIREN